jgi:hypothetical protein
MMDDQLTRVSTIIRERSPEVFCPPCLASSLNMTEHDVRQGLQVVVVGLGYRQQFAMTNRMCSECGAQGDYVELRR